VGGGSGEAIASVVIMAARARNWREGWVTRRVVNCRSAYPRRSVYVCFSRQAATSGIIREMTVSLIALLLMPAAARVSVTASEWWLTGAFVAAGLVLAGCLFPLLDCHIRYLEARKQPRGTRGRELVAQMEAPSRFVAGGQRGASLRGRDLRGEDLRDAFLDDVDLSDTDLRGVDLSGASLDGTHFLDARYDAATRWPAGLDPSKHGAILEK
jgi:hypothetical protein